MKKVVAFFCFLSILLSRKKDDDTQIMVLDGEWGLVREETYHTLYKEIVADSSSVNTNKVKTLKFYTDTMLLKNHSDTIEFGKYEAKNDTIYYQHNSIELKFHFYFKNDTLVINEKIQKMSISCSSNIPIDGTDSAMTCTDPILVEESSINSFYIRK